MSPGRGGKLNFKIGCRQKLSRDPIAIRAADCSLPRGKRPASGAGLKSAGEEIFPHTDKAIRGPDCMVDARFRRVTDGRAAARRRACEHPRPVRPVSTIGEPA